MKRMTYQAYIDYNVKKNSDPEFRDKLIKNRPKKVAFFVDKFRRLGLDYAGKTVLCLGARLGEEVEGFNVLGAQAIGLDLVPYPPLVREGDMNKIALDSTFDLVYTNSFDHVYDIADWVVNVRNVLNPGGMLVLSLFPQVFDEEEEEVAYVEGMDDALAILGQHLRPVRVEKDTPQWFKQYTEEIYVYQKDTQE
jgi:SAM-dependent methyltransferase